MRSGIIFRVAGLMFAAASLFLATEARADVVKLRLKAEVSVPYLVVHPPQPIIRPRRITMHLVEREHTYVRVFGHHHHRHHVRVGYHAPAFAIRTRVVGPRIVGPSIAIGGPHIGLPGPPRLRGPRVGPPSVVVIGRGGPPGHFKHKSPGRGPSKGHGGGRGHGGRGHGKRR